MSRVGKMPVALPRGVSFALRGECVEVKGPKGTMSQDFGPSVSIECRDEFVIVSPADSSSFARAMQGTVRSIIAGMVKGVCDGYSKSLTINGVGFKGLIKGQFLELSVGYSDLVRYPLPRDVSVDVFDNNKITVRGVSKHRVGQVTNEIYSYCPAEPYKGRGISIDGKPVRRKEGKKTA